MDPQVASEIVALRPALESLVVRISQEPEQIMDLGEVDKKVTNHNHLPFICIHYYSLNLFR